VPIMNNDAAGGRAVKTLNSSWGKLGRGREAGFLLSDHCLGKSSPADGKSSALMGALQSVGNGAGGMLFPAPRIAEA
jgi:hypothetical protein